MKLAARLDALSSYAFAELDKLAAERRAAGVEVIDFGVGDPTDPPPDTVIEAAERGLHKHRRSGYPSYIGGAAFRRAVAAWWERRYGLGLDADAQVSGTIGSKEAVFHLPLAFVDPGDVVLGPSPGYPPYARGTVLAGGRYLAYPVAEDGPILPDLDQLPDEVSRRLAVVWITQPHVPTGRMASRAELERLASQVRARGALLCSDEAYSELWMDQPPETAMVAGTDHVLVFQSLSKRAAMTGYRVGFVSGDARAVEAFRRVKTNIDSGTPWFVEEAAIAALADEQAPAAARIRYGERAELLVAALRGIGCQVDMPSAGFYLWARTPGGTPGVAFAQRLLGEAPALAVMPGEWLTDPVAPEFGGSDDAASPGAGRVRWALVPSLALCRQAAERLADWTP